MNDAQKMLFDYCQQNGFLQTESFGDAEVYSVDQHRNLRHLTINIYGDIFDIGAHRIIAVSNTSHDSLDSFERPTFWTPYVHKKKSSRERLEKSQRLVDSMKG